jgi:hypothetical protein
MTPAAWLRTFAVQIRVTSTFKPDFYFYFLIEVDCYPKFAWNNSISRRDI